MPEVGTFQRRQPIAGFDCFPPHDYPPQRLCAGELCQAWVQKFSIQGLCNSDHAHREHYWKPAHAPHVFHCEGREYCDSKYQPPTQPA